MSQEAHKPQRDWIVDGNSPYGTLVFYADEQGCEMDFISGWRITEILRGWQSYCGSSLMPNLLAIFLIFLKSGCGRTYVLFCVISTHFFIDIITVS